ncbi:hypothetical protein JQ543_23895 [Bradyrhizobium diazoefficiens]|nr:hypothetical protein [Bradyrhizobium diazoefficiens]MBR0850805.1 hypothetical protein [Bradyrhizobium diazoefficiens]
MQKPVQRSTLLDQADHAIATGRRLQNELTETVAAAQAQCRRREHWQTLQSRLVPAVAISLGVRARAGDQAQTQATLPSAQPASRLQRIARARQIVTRQREIVATAGETLPAAFALLNTYERLLAALESSQAVHQRSDASVGITGLGGPDQDVEAAASGSARQSCAAGAGSGAQEQMELVARILEILREGGYGCEMERSTIH